MEKNSFIIYRSFVEAIRELDPKLIAEAFIAYSDYALDGKELSSDNPILNTIFKLVKPNVDAATRRYLASTENGKKGGRPKKGESKEEYNNRNNLNKPNNNLNKPNNNLNEPNQNLNVNVNDNVNEDDNVELNDNIKPEKETKEKEDEVELNTSTSNIEKENQEIENLKNSIVLENSDDDDLTFNEETKSTKNSTSTSFSSSSLSSFPNTGKTSNLYYQEIHKKVNSNDKDTMNLSDYVYEEIAKGIETIAFEYRIPNKKFDTRCKDIFFTCLRQLQDLTGVDEDRGKDILVKSINNIVEKNSNKLANVSTGLI